MVQLAHVQRDEARKQTGVGQGALAVRAGGSTRHSASASCRSVTRHGSVACRPKMAKQPRLQGNVGCRLDHQGEQAADADTVAAVGSRPAAQHLGTRRQVPGDGWREGNVLFGGCPRAVLRPTTPSQDTGCAPP
eukprot:scaffold36120_cov169-Isochrysis_galbana.AAC.3